MLKRGKKSKKVDTASVQILTETIKSILSYLDDITDRLKEFEVEIKSLTLRLEHLERNLTHSSVSPKVPPELPPLPHLESSRQVQRPHEANTYQGPPSDVKSELKTVLEGGRRLKTVEQGKHDHFMELRSAVHEEYKSSRQKPRQAPISPLTSAPQSGNDSEGRNQLKNDLDDSLKKMKKKLKK
jgi:hypothetical protein